MDERLVLCAGSSPALRYACGFLQSFGIPTANAPNMGVTHLLLDVPSFGPDGRLRLGGSVENLLSQLSKDVVICGGNLNHPALAGYHCIDFLQDAAYLAENAYITAECALDVALPYLSITLRDCPTLILGWGRIGKCLGNLLKAIGADVTIAARKESDRAMIGALGYRAESMGSLDTGLGYFRLIFNTVPELILEPERAAGCHPECVMIDLASKPGIESDNVITARGLPGIHMPESSGLLIAKTLLRLL